MISAPIPANESERLADLRALELLDTPTEERFDRITRLAISAFKVPIAYIALVDEDRQWFKAQCGLTASETGRSESFCGHTILHSEPMIIPDATLDERFADNPLVVGEPHIRFYAGYPLRGPQGWNVGTLCIADRTPRTLEAMQVDHLRELAALAEHELNLVDLIRAQRELLETKNALVRTQRQLAEEIRQASAYVRAMLPPRLEGPVRTDWQFIASSQLGGDLLGYHWLDGERLAVYLLDVCGHGVSAALLSIAMYSALRRQTLPNTDFTDAAAVLTALNQAFPMTAHGGKFATVFYAVYHRTQRQLRYASAGHPPGLLYPPGATAPTHLAAANLPVGILTDQPCTDAMIEVPPGARLYVYSDGAYEMPISPEPEAPLLMVEGLTRVIAAIGETDARPLAIRDRVLAQSGAAAFPDDFSMLEIEFS